MAGHPSGFGRASSVSSRTPPVRAPSSSSSAFEKSVAAPPPSRTVAAPPAYTPGGSVAAHEGAAAAQSAKRAPPPPPLKAKPSFSATPPVKYVVALFDFEAQVRSLACGRAVWDGSTYACPETTRPPEISASQRATGSSWLNGRATLRTGGRAVSTADRVSSRVRRCLCS